MNITEQKINELSEKIDGLETMIFGFKGAYKIQKNWPNPLLQRLVKIEQKLKKMEDRGGFYLMPIK